MATIKKAIVKRSDLPPLVVQPVGESKWFTITNVQQTTYNSKPAFLYTTETNHTFKKGDTVSIIEALGAANPFEFDSIEIAFVPPDNLSQFIVYGSSIEVFVPATQLKVFRIPESYYVRYRVVSEDLNRTSHWSPVYSLTALYQDYEDPDSVSIRFIIPDPLDLASSSVFIKWDMPSESVSTQNYDVYIAWGTSATVVEGYSYYATVAGNQITVPLGAGSALLPSNILSIKVAVQVSTLPLKKRISALTVAESTILELFQNS